MCDPAKVLIASLHSHLPRCTDGVLLGANRHDNMKKILPRVMMDMPKLPVAEITLQQSSFIPSLQSRFLFQIREHAITWWIAYCPDKQYRCNPLPRLSPAYRSESNTHINAQTMIRMTSIAVQPHGNHSRASTSMCPYEHVSLTKQATHEPSRVSFIQRYGKHNREPCNVNYALGPIKGHSLPPSQAIRFGHPEFIRTHLFLP
jgi:hypothetical protein